MLQIRMENGHTMLTKVNFKKESFNAFFQRSKLKAIKTNNGKKHFEIAEDGKPYPSLQNLCKCVTVAFEKDYTPEEMKKAKEMGRNLSPLEWQATNSNAYKMEGEPCFSGVAGGDYETQLQLEWIGYLMRRNMVTVTNKENGGMIFRFAKVFTPFKVWFIRWQFFNGHGAVEMCDGNGTDHITLL